MACLVQSDLISRAAPATLSGIWSCCVILRSEISRRRHWEKTQVRVTVGLLEISKVAGLIDISRVLAIYVLQSRTKMSSRFRALVSEPWQGIMIINHAVKSIWERE